MSWQQADGGAAPTRRHRHAELVEQIDEHRFRYYVLDAPTVVRRASTTR